MGTAARDQPSLPSCPTHVSVVVGRRGLGAHDDSDARPVGHGMRRRARDHVQEPLDLRQSATVLRAAPYSTFSASLALSVSAHHRS
jgi:hypothetical protein